MPSLSPIEILKQGSSCELLLVSWRSGFESQLISHVDECAIASDRSAVGLLYLWSSIAFLEAQALSVEGIPPVDYQLDDGWSSLDFLENLLWEGDQLRLNLNVIRGRQVTTEISISSGGLFVVTTQGRGDSALRWFESFQT